MVIENAELLRWLIILWLSMLQMRSDTKEMGLSSRKLLSDGAQFAHNLTASSTPGFSTVKPDRLIKLPTELNQDKKDNSSSYDTFGQSPVLNVKPRPGKRLFPKKILKLFYSLRLLQKHFIIEISQ